MAASFVLQLETGVISPGKRGGGGGGGEKDVNVRSSDEFNFSCESNIRSSFGVTFQLFFT